jgi:hypothetical protein
MEPVRPGWIAVGTASYSLAATAFDDQQSPAPSPVSALSAASPSPMEDPRLVALRSELAATQLRSAALEATMRELMRPPLAVVEPPPPQAEAPTAAPRGAAADTTSAGGRVAAHLLDGEDSVEAEHALGGTILTTIAEVSDALTNTHAHYRTLTACSSILGRTTTPWLPCFRRRPSQRRGRS